VSWGKIARRAISLALAACLVAATGCLSGGIYTHVTRPLDLNLDHTPVHDGKSGDSWKTLHIPITSGLFVQFDWGSDAIGDGARKAGITTIYYADLETLQVLGIWSQRWAIVYGE
jgi:hypothetical protein